MRVSERYASQPSTNTYQLMDFETVFALEINRPNDSL